MIAQLGDHHCFALDMRGHGRSSAPDPPYNWRDFGVDLVAVARHFGVRGALAVGHSMGGHATALAAALAPELFHRLVLIDPVILPRAAYAEPPRPEHFAARRRNRWASAAEMVDRFGDRLPFSRWEPQVLRDYCEYGLRPAPDGDGYVLACPPAVEAAIYAASINADIYAELATVQAPVQVIRCGTPRPPATWDMSASPTAPDLAAQFAHGSDRLLPEYSHFMPMEAPALAAKLIASEPN